MHGAPHALHVALHNAAARFDAEIRGLVARHRGRRDVGGRAHTATHGAPAVTAAASPPGRALELLEASVAWLRDALGNDAPTPTHAAARAGGSARSPRRAPSPPGGGGSGSGAKTAAPVPTPTPVPAAAGVKARDALPRRSVATAPTAASTARTIPKFRFRPDASRPSSPPPPARQPTPRRRSAPSPSPPPARRGSPRPKPATPRRQPPSPVPPRDRRDAGTQVTEGLLVAAADVAVAGGVGLLAVVALRKLDAFRRRDKSQHLRALTRPACPKCAAAAARRRVHFRTIPAECAQCVLEYLRVGDREAFALMHANRRFYTLGKAHLRRTRRLVLDDASAIAHVMNGGLPDAAEIVVYVRPESLAVFKQFITCQRARAPTTRHLAVHATGFMDVGAGWTLDLPHLERLELSAAPLDNRFFARHPVLRGVHAYRFVYPLDVVVDSGVLPAGHPLRVMLYGFNHPVRDPGVALDLPHLRALGILENSTLPLAPHLTVLVCRAHAATDILETVHAFCPRVRHLLVVVGVGAARAAAPPNLDELARTADVAVEACTLGAVFRRACELTECMEE